MASANGYRPQAGIDLYATTGTTEDWAYAATGTFGYTIEHGYQFHPSFDDIRPMFLQNVETFLRLVEAAGDTRLHSLINGTVTSTAGTPLDATLHLTKTVLTTMDADVFAPLQTPRVSDTIDISMQTGEDGAFAWHVNPSTRPIAGTSERYMLTVNATGYAAQQFPVEIARGQTVTLPAITLSPA